MVVRPVREGEGDRLRALRLRALADAPDAFGATVERDAARPARDWADLAMSGTVFAAEQDGEWVGMAAVLPRDEDALVWGTWVAPEARRTGAGRALMEAVAGWARPRGIPELTLSVSETAPAAEALYAGLGYRRTGRTEPLRDHVQHVMALFLEPWEPRIATERLLMRRYVPGDFEAMHDMRAREDVVRWLYEDVPTVEENRERFHRRMHNTRFARTGDGIAFAVEHGDTLVADVSLMLHSAEHRQGEIGFIVHPDHQGRGYATEAARAVVALGFETFGLHRVFGTLEGRNAGSAGVLERLGMRREAHLEENEWVKGEWQSEVVYAVLAREWAGAQSQPRLRK